MINEIFIENRKLDISEGLSNFITYQIDDIKNIGSRETNFSKTIVLPGTANNNLLFGHIFNVLISNAYDSTQPNVGYNFNASKEASSMIFQNHLQVFKGIIRLLKVVIVSGVPEYECAVFGELAGLVNSIGNAKIESLDFSVYDHILSIPNVTGSWDTFNGSGYVYPLIDYGGVSTGKVDYDLAAFRPALSVREYVDKIITEAGYSYDCELFDTPRFRKLLVPNNQKTFQQLSSTILYVYTTLGYNVISPSFGTSDSGLFSFDTLALLGSFSANVAKTEFTYGGADTLQTLFQAELNITLSGQYTTFSFRLLKNGTPIYDFGDIYRAFPSSITTVLEIADLPVQIVQNDVFSIEVTAQNSLGLGASFVYVNEAILTVRTPNDVYIDINIGDTISINDTIPRNILQRDFLSSVVKLFNLYVYEDKLKNKFLNIKPQVDFYNASGVVDWTYKMDRGRRIELIPMSELNSRFYDFKFKTDSDYYSELYSKRYNEGYGDYLFDSQFFLAGDKSTVDIIFASTPLVGYSGVDKIVSPMYRLSNTTEEPTATIIRMLQFKKVTGVTSWAIKDGVTTLHTTTDYPYAGHYDDPDAPANDIHFGVPRELFFTLATGAINVTQFNVYWSPYMAEITDKDSKMLTAYFKLNNRDIYDLDFSKFVYVDGSLFRLNKIIDWNASEPDVCKVELLKVIYQSY